MSEDLLNKTLRFSLYFSPIVAKEAQKKVYNNNQEAG